MRNFIDFLNIEDKSVAIAVSGGADSLALTLMAAENLKDYGIKVVALTVDHQLRPTSAKEASYVSNIMKQNGIEHHILVWDKNDIPAGSLETKAREARYKLLQDWCVSHDINVLMTAHHLYDQIETFLMRLQRGSGLEGLCGMREISYRENLKIIRPLLYEDPQIMKEYLLKKNITWIEDESNKNLKYLRNKIRNFIPEFIKHTKITPDKIATAVRNLQSSDHFINMHTMETLARDVIKTGDVYCFRYANYKNWHKEIKFRILSFILKDWYIPRAGRILNLIAKLDKLPFNGATLGNHEIFIFNENIWIVPEIKANKEASRKLWKEFCASHPEFTNKKIPHKARVAILKYYERKNDI